MNARDNILLGWILSFLIFVAARARGIPDFQTDEDIDAWHKFGLRSFYGPWSVVARRSNGDFVSYADYGAPVPLDFRPIFDDHSSRGSSHAERQYPSKYTPGLSDFAAINDFPFGEQTHREDNAITLNSRTDFQQLIEALGGKTTDKESKRDTLELIGIVGLISDDGDSSENYSSTLSTRKFTTDTEDGDDPTTVTDQSPNFTG